MTTTSTAPAGRSGAARMRGRAHVATALCAGSDGRGDSRVTGLRSEGPLVLRPTIGKGREPWVRGRRGAARVSLASGAAGPIGGDRLELAVDVGAGSTLVLTEVSHTLCLPGRDGARSTTTVRITVEDGGALVWLPEPVIAAHRSDHVVDVEAALGPGARLLAREEVLLGRHGEPAGRVRQRTRVTQAGRVLYQQDLGLGSEDGSTPAVVDDHRAVGSVLVVDPAWSGDSRPPARGLGSMAALMPLAGPAVLVSALAGDSLALRSALEAGVAALGGDWVP